jgi:hypothetical protein
VKVVISRRTMRDESETKLVRQAMREQRKLLIRFRSRNGKNRTFVRREIGKE